jgi:LysM repeat protein
MFTALVLTVVTVQPGQTLSGIAASNEVSVAALEAANPQLTDPNLVYPGEHINLPGSGGSAPAVQPASVAPVSAVPGSYQSCVIQHESSGNPDAENSGHWGLYQMTENLWVLGGGSPSDYGSASAAEQSQVFQNILANNINGGTSNWTPYDGC